MIDRPLFGPGEMVPFFGILITILAIIVYGYVKDYRIFWSPLTVVAVIFGYYCCLGPYEAMTNNETYDRLVNMRKYYPSAFWGAWISLCSIAIGFLSTGRGNRPVQVVPEVDHIWLLKYGRRIFFIGLLFFSFSTGGNVLGLINPLDAEYLQQDTGGFSNYFLLAINFLIPGICLLFAYWLRTRRQVFWVLIPVVISVGIYITIGFRYRVILLFCSLAITYYLHYRKKPNAIIASALIIVLIAFMGIINLTRTYGGGLDTKKLEGKDTEAFYRSGMRESMIFQTSGAVIDHVPDDHPYVGFDPVISTFFFPIPKQFYPEKNSAGYIVSILQSIYGPKNFKGGAFMAYAEHYLSFGWYGVCLFGFVIGWIFKRIWVWYLANVNNSLCIVAYAVTVSYLYVILSRGYLPQVTMLFFFSAYPAFVVIYFVRRQYSRINLARRVG